MTQTFSFDELEQAKRNHGLPLEALRYPITPPGLHYLLQHYDVPAVDASAWRLAVGGLVERPLTLTLDEIQALPAVEHAVTLECAGNGRARMPARPVSQPWLEDGVSTARWRGTRLGPILERAGVLADARDIVFTGADRGIELGNEQSYQRSLTVSEAVGGESLLVYEMNGQPLLPQHGFPLRLLVPGWYGMASVKWLTSIEAVAAPFRGHHQVVAYVVRHDPGEDGQPITLMLPRALVIPPGIPGFPARTRTIDLGECLLEGRAWSGAAPIESVSVSTDGGTTWSEAELVHDLDSAFAWTGWRYRWAPAAPGEYELCCRARDAAGGEQPLEPADNLGGYVNNGVQRVQVTVRPSAA